MPPHSRPPLTHRIRSSLDGIRRKSDFASPAPSHGSAVEDPESLRNAIEQAICSESFQTAIATRLAELIEPSIKTALDTIQPVIETVYAHDVLLKRGITDADEDGLGPGSASHGSTTPPDSEGVKDLLKEYNTQSTTKISELASLVEAGNSKIAKMELSLAGMHSASSLSVERLSSLHSTLEQSIATMSSMKTQLDKLKADISVLSDSVGSDVGKNMQVLLESIVIQEKSLLPIQTRKLETLSSDIAELKSDTKTRKSLETTSAKLDTLKADLDTVTVSNTHQLDDLKTKASNILTMLESQSRTLDGIKNTEKSAEILAVVQESNAYHASHATSLHEIKDRSITDPAPIIRSSNEEMRSTLKTLTADLAGITQKVETGLSSSNGSLLDLGKKLDTVHANVEGIQSKDVSGEVLTAVQESNKFHAIHATALTAIKESNAVMGSEIASLVKSNMVATLKPQIGTIITTLDSHTSLLSEIREADMSAEILTALHACNESHASHATALDEIREEDVSDEILTALHTSHEFHASHDAELKEIKAALKAVHITPSGQEGQPSLPIDSPLGADSSKERVSRSKHDAELENDVPEHGEKSTLETKSASTSLSAPSVKIEDTSTPQTTKQASP